MGSVRKVILSGLLDCAAADIICAPGLLGKNFYTNTGSDAREACKATLNLVLTESLP
jgi:hypothetical protein